MNVINEYKDRYLQPTDIYHKLTFVQIDHYQGVKLAQDTLTALQAKRAELAVAPSPSPRVRNGQCGVDIHDDEIHNMVVMKE